MKAKYKRKWIKALRSGEYEQGKASLRTDDKFCCLGVLCDIVADDLNLSWEPIDPYSGEYAFGGSGGFLPESVKNLVGLTSMQGAYKDYQGNGRALSDDNDNGKSFKQIANIIERRF